MNSVLVQVPCVAHTAPLWPASLQGMHTIEQLVALPGGIWARTICIGQMLNSCWH